MAGISEKIRRDRKGDGGIGIGGCGNWGGRKEPWEGNAEMDVS